MKIILIGPPGVGKGTQSNLLQKKYDFKALSSGDILRQEVNSDSELGIYTKTFLDTGQLLPDEMIVKIIIDHLSKFTKEQDAILFDGFPRTIGQAQKLDSKLEDRKTKIDYVFVFEASSKKIFDRLGGRITCSSCNAIYHMKNHPPIQSEICDRCGSLLFVRTDDKKEAIMNRLNLYRSLTYPLIEYYTGLGKAHRIDAELPSQDVFDSVCSILDTVFYS